MGRSKEEKQAFTTPGMATPPPNNGRWKGLQSIQRSPPVSFRRSPRTSASSLLCNPAHSLKQRKVKMPPGFPSSCGLDIRVSNCLPPWAAVQGFTALFTVQALPAWLTCFPTRRIHTHLSHLEKTRITRHCVLMGALFRLREIFVPVTQ